MEATYLINRMPKTILGINSPYSTLYKSVSDYKFMKVFGCACYPHLGPYNSHKFDYHFKECVFLGYSSNHKGYKCLSSDRCIYISKDVIFNEMKSHYFSIFNSPPTPLSPPHVMVPFNPIPLLLASPATQLIPPLSSPAQQHLHSVPLHSTSLNSPMSVLKFLPPQSFHPLQPPTPSQFSHSFSPIL